MSGVMFSKDASGVPRSIVTAAQAGWDEPTRAALNSVLRRATIGGERQGSAGHTRSSVFSLGVFCYVGLFVAVGAIVMFVPGKAAAAVGASALALGGLGLWVLSRKSSTFAGGNVPEQLVYSWLTERRCPSCAYPLNTELTGEKRGLWRCTECGGIWKPVVEVPS